MLSLLKWIGAPGSIGFLALCCAVGLAFRAAGGTRLGRAWLLAVYVLHVVAGLPIVANVVASSLSTYRPIENLAAVQSADAVIILHGDNVLGRAREAKRIFDATGAPIVLVSGGPDFAGYVVANGIPADRLVADDTASNTFDQIVNVTRFVRERHLKKPVLIASRLQMPRIAALVHAAGLQILLAPSPIDDEPPVTGIRQFLPVYKALRVTGDATYELVALRYYRHKRLIKGV